MKNTLLTVLSLFLLTPLFAQKFELSAQANSGLYHYSGSSSASVSSINEGSTSKANYTNNPYGNKNGFSYGASLQGQYVAKCGFIMGLQAGYDFLQSKVDLNFYYPLVYPTEFEPLYTPFTFNQVPVKGQTFLQNQDINLDPYIGYRIKTSKVNIDITPGVDVAFNISSYDKGNATDDQGNVYRTDLKRPDAPTDVRARVGIAAAYQQFGITLSYAHGLTNLERNMIGDNATYDLHSNLFRFGVTYRIL